MNDEIRADQIEVLERGVFKTEHIFQTPLEIHGVLTLKGGRANGTYSGSDGSNLEFTKTKVWKSHYELREGNGVLANAAPRKKIGRALIINYEDKVFGLFPGGSKLRSWMIKDDLGQVLAEINPRGGFKRGANIRIFLPVPFNLLVFSYCLVQKRWQEQSS